MLGPAARPGLHARSRASANDALAAPFVLAGFFVVERDGAGWLAEWALADVLYAILVAL